MAKRESDKSAVAVGMSMRPNADISHELNGRVKDYAERENLELVEAYRRVIEAGIERLEQDQ